MSEVLGGDGFTPSEGCSLVGFCGLGFCQEILTIYLAKQLKLGRVSLSCYPFPYHV